MTSRTTKAPRGPRTGSRVDTLHKLSIGATMTEAVYLRCQHMGPDDIDKQAWLIRHNLSAAMIRAQRLTNGSRYTINTGFFRTQAGDFIVAGVVTRTA